MRSEACLTEGNWASTSGERASGNETEVLMFSKSLSLVFAFGCSLAITVPLAEAQVACGQRDLIINALGGKYKESRQALGLVGKDGQGIIELFVSDKGTWTMLMTTAKGNTCIVATGLGWQDAPKKLAGPAI